MNDMVTSIAILLTVHNRKVKTLECLRCVFDQESISDKYSLHVFLVDDASSDGTREAVTDLYPSVHIIDGDGQLYWNRGMHLAWETAVRLGDYDYYLWLNDDTYIHSDAILHLLNCAEQTADQALICGFLCSADQPDRTTYGGSKSGKKLDPTGKLQEVEIMNGNVVLVPRSVYERVGIIDPIFPHAIGDFDYGLRAQKKGVKIYGTKRYIGTCENNPKLPRWCYSSTPLFQRIKALYSPLGSAHPYYFFIYERRHFGFSQAVKHFFSIHLRALIPSLWK